MAEKIRVTVGTAGKVFLGEPASWLPLPKMGPISREDALPARPQADSPAPVQTPAFPGRLDLALLIDHTLLRPDAAARDIERLCAEARQFRFATVCVNPGWVPLAARLLQGSGVRVCAVAGFPLGASTSMVKALEARDAIAGGADEIDMVLNLGRLKSGDWAQVGADIAAVRAATAGKVLKVILETALLTDDEKRAASILSVKEGAEFVKTSTGFGSGGATVQDVRLMRAAVGPGPGVKASGGIRERAFAEQLVAAGATRLGTSYSVALVGTQA